MAQITSSIDVEAPLRSVYNQWTQFEEFPKFMEGVKEVRQLGDKTLQWRAEIGGKDVEWIAQITDQEPDRRIAWRSSSGAQNNGALSFESLDPNKTRVSIAIDYEPTGAVEATGSALGVVKARVSGDLKRFKEYIEKRGRETGGWRGTIRGGDVRGPQSNERGAGA